MKEQLQRNIDWNRQQGYASGKDLNVQQITERGNLDRGVFQPQPAQPQANATPQKEQHWSGSIGMDGVRGPKDGPDGMQATLQYSSNPRVKEADDQQQQKISLPTTNDPVKIDKKEFDEANNPDFP